jgi:hypothetical protein
MMHDPDDWTKSADLLEVFKRFQDSSQEKEQPFFPLVRHAAFAAYFPGSARGHITE